MDFCNRIKELPLGKLEYECDYNNIRKFCKMAFMDDDARHLDKITPGRSEKDFFMQSREVVVALVSELGKATLPKVEI